MRLEQRLGHAMVLIGIGCFACMQVLGSREVVHVAMQDEDAQMSEQVAPKHTNRLSKETSPYLLQHQHNPVDWYPWNPEAIEHARREDKPIFLSIGYSTCYWCHVMERESFEDEATAAVMNQDFVSIKVDREQRPDVDEIYMTACQVFTRMTTGRSSGGWPLSVFIDPYTLQPFFVGTYFPPKPQGGRPSFTQVCEAMAEAWREQRDAVVAQANQIATIVARSLEAGDAARPLGDDQVRAAIDQLMSIHDRTYGGFGSAPKFPQPVFLELLMEAGWDRPPIREAIQRTLDAMARGGIYDQVGGGFHRYSVDEKWLVPHFEKMLYDNGQLASVYAESFARTGDAYHKQIIEETLDYVLREMTDEETGAFWSAQDAEVNRHEGENYLWTPQEVTDALQSAGLSDEVPLTLRAFGLDQGPNFQDPHHRELPPTNVLFRSVRPDELAKAEGVTDAELEAFFQRIRPVLYKERMTRDQPGLDDKVITAWNGMMIRGMADGGRVLEQPSYIDAAARAARHILTNMRSDDGGLMRTARGGQSSIRGFLEDYACLARGLIALYDATEDVAWLTAASEIIEAARVRFWGDDGAWFDTMADQDDLFVRSRNLNDGAVPSGIGTMLLVCQDMSDRTGEDWYLDDFQSAITRLSGSYAANPLGSVYATLATARMLVRDPGRLPHDAVIPATTVVATQEPEVLSFDGTDTVEGSVQLAIAEGFHINARDPGLDELIGVELALVGAEGLELSVTYPEGVLYREQIRIYAGTITIPFTIRRTGSVSGEPELALRWQACTDQVCFAPEQVRLPVQIQETD